MGDFLDRFKKEPLADSASDAEVQQALLALGPIKINRVCEALDIDKRGRKAKNVVDIMEAIEEGELDRDDVIDVFNAYVALKDVRIKKTKNAFKVFRVLFDEFKDVRSKLQFLKDLINLF